MATTLVLSGLDWLRVFSAGQVLSLPSGALGVRHKQARKVVTDLLGFCPPGKPVNGTRDAVLDWLGLEEAN